MVKPQGTQSLTQEKDTVKTERKNISVESSVVLMEISSVPCWGGGGFFLSLLCPKKKKKKDRTDEREGD